MKPIAHASFEQLRLRDFIEDCSVIEDWEFMEDSWMGEAIGFTEFLSPTSQPSQTMSISVDLENLDAEITWQLFERLGLELEKGLTEEEIREDFGNDFIRESFREDRTTLVYLIGSSEREYYASFTIDNKAGMVYFTMMNHAKTRDSLKTKLQQSNN